MTKSQLFKSAHKLAKTFVGSYQACFSLALKTLYAAFKKVAVKAWFFKKLNSTQQNTLTKHEHSITKETEKAIFVERKLGENSGLWIPKSVLCSVEEFNAEMNPTPGTSAPVQLTPKQQYREYLIHVAISFTEQMSMSRKNFQNWRTETLQNWLSENCVDFKDLETFISL
ncbi:MAG: hypothetical protein ACRDCC_06310 [Culicoidibacterales bacterium]